MKIDNLIKKQLTEIVGEAKEKNLVFKEIPIKTIYTKYSNKKGQNIFNAINIITKLISIRFSKKLWLT